MTQAEKKREEIRLLNLKVDDLKKQNNDYAKDTEELIERKTVAFDEAVRASERLQLLEEEVEHLEGEITTLKPTTERYRDGLSELSERVRELEAEKVGLAGEIDQQTKDIKDNEGILEGLKKEIEESGSVLEVKYASLKGFEEQLGVREALLRKREEALDLKEMGVKVSE